MFFCVALALKHSLNYVHLHLKTNTKKHFSIVPQYEEVKFWISHSNVEKYFVAKIFQYLEVNLIEVASQSRFLFNQVRFKNCQLILTSASSNSSVNSGSPILISTASMFAPGMSTSMLRLYNKIRQCAALHEILQFFLTSCCGRFEQTRMFRARNYKISTLRNQVKFSIFYTVLLTRQFAKISIHSIRNHWHVHTFQPQCE